MPEEINRIVADAISDILFAPTKTAVDTLVGEGIPPSRVHLVGDVMYDSAKLHAERATQNSHILERLGLSKSGYILATLHRAENTDVPERLTAILGGLESVATDIPVLLPLHPRTRGAIALLGDETCFNRAIRFIDPVGYLDMVQLEMNALLIATDSGGIQKEAFFHGIPCVILRDETEWVELVQMGWNTIVPPISSADVEMGIRARINTRGIEGAPYGNGDAAERIAKILSEAWGE